LFQRKAETMKNEKGVSKLVLFLIIAIIIIAAIYWARYFAKPMATVMMGGAEQARPAIEKAKQASDAVNRNNQATEDAARKVIDDAAK
jgi:uncharacterized protein (UPF0333 family)